MKSLFEIVDFHEKKNKMIYSLNQFIKMRFRLT